MNPEPTGASPPSRRIPPALRNLLIVAAVIAGLVVWWKIDEARGFERRAQAEIPKLIAELNNPDAYLRARAANQLQHFGSRAREATPALVKMLEDPQEHPRTSATFALRSIGPEVLPSVLPLLESGKRDSRLAVLNLIRDFGPPALAAAPALIRMLDSTDPEQMQRADSALSALGEEAFPVILGHLKEAKPQLRAQLIRTVRGKADLVVPPLAKIVDEDPEARVKLAALEILSRYKKEAAPATPAAARALESNDQLVRSYAADVLGHVGSEAFEPVLAACSNPRVEVRERALYALGAIGKEYRSDQVIAVLTSAAGDPDWTIRRIAFSGMCGLSERARSCVPIAIKGLQDPRPDVRLTAASALEHIGVATPEVLAALEKAESDPDPQVRPYAESARSRLSGKK